MAEMKNKFVNGLKSPKGRFNHPHLVKPDMEGQFASKKYKTTLLIPKDTDIKELKKACAACARDAFGADVNLKDLQMPFKDGDLKLDKETQEILDGYEDHWYITCKSNRKPTIVDRARQNMDADLIKAGDYGRVGLSAMSYTGSEQVKMPDGSKVTEEYQGITFLLEAVQFLEEGDSLGGGGGGRVSGNFFDDGEFEDENSDNVVVGSDSDEDEELF